MIMTVIACGDSAKGWIPRGTTIGSNDCEKFGNPVDYLVLANAPRKFTPERMKVITKSKAQVLTTSLSQWKPFFPSAEKIPKVTTFNKMIMKGYCQTSVTTPIMCLSLAIRMGATEIIMYGCDMLTHKTWRKGTKGGDQEITKYLRYFKEMNRIGVKLWLGVKGTAFDGVVPVYADLTDQELQWGINAVEKYEAKVSK